MTKDQKKARLSCTHHMPEQMPYAEIENPAIVLLECVRYAALREILLPEIYQFSRLTYGLLIAYVGYRVAAKISPHQNRQHALGSCFGGSQRATGFELDKS
jgi:hypothetical protein